MKSIIFRDVSPCSPVEVHRRFGGTLTDVSEKSNTLIIRVED
jgi:hypothetical protein